MTENLGAGAFGKTMCRSEHIYSIIKSGLQMHRHIHNLHKFKWQRVLRNLKIELQHCKIWSVLQMFGDVTLLPIIIACKILIMSHIVAIIFKRRLVDSERFRWWCETYIITGFLNFDYPSGCYAPETGSSPVSRWRQVSTYCVVSLRKCYLHSPDEAGLSAWG
jgi:hypothetical protein